MVIIFSLLLISGIIAGQAFDFSAVRGPLTLITSACLAYIMIEVGLEFSAEKRDIRSYGWDSAIAAGAAILPALLWFGYFLMLQTPWKPALLSGLSAAPTSAGVLFAMLMAAGLSSTWVFKKARVLAVLDDLLAILLLTPLQVIIQGFHWESAVLISLILFLLFASFRWQNILHWPVSPAWMLGYGTALAVIVFFVRNTTHIHLEVLIPAFTLGCLMRLQGHGPAPSSMKLSLDSVIKGLFMFLVGLSFPKVEIGSIPLAATVGHVVMLTILSNVGKSFILFCYSKEVSLKERLALSIAMYPRGEVGAAVLLIALGYGFGGYVTSLALLSLALNLVLTGAFIWAVIKLLEKKQTVSL